MREAVKLGLREAVGLGVRLMLFALVAGLLLAVVNAVTEGPIAQNERLKADGARIAVIGDYAFEAVGADTSGYDAIQGVYAALDGDGQTVGYVYELASRGYGGDVVLSVGIRDGAVSGVAIASHSETKGLGTADEAPFFAALPGAYAGRGGGKRGRDGRRDGILRRGCGAQWHRHWRTRMASWAQGGRDDGYEGLAQDVPKRHLQ